MGRNLVRERLGVACALSHRELSRRHEQHFDARRFVAHAPRQTGAHDRLAQDGVRHDTGVAVLLDDLAPVERCRRADDVRLLHGRRRHGIDGVRGTTRGRRCGRGSDWSDLAREHGASGRRFREARRGWAALHELGVPDAIEIVDSCPQAVTKHRAVVRLLVAHHHHAGSVQGHHLLKHPKPHPIDRDGGGVLHGLSLLHGAAQLVRRHELRVGGHCRFLHFLLAVRLGGNERVLELRRDEHAVDHMHDARADGDVAGDDPSLEGLLERAIAHRAHAIDEDRTVREHVEHETIVVLRDHRGGAAAAVQVEAPNLELRQRVPVEHGTERFPVLRVEERRTLLLGEPREGLVRRNEDRPAAVGCGLGPILFATTCLNGGDEG